MTSAAIDLRLGDWRTALADVEMVDAVITDPPYSDRVHAGHDNGVRESRGLSGARRSLNYGAWSPDDVREFVASWAPRNRGWFVCLSDHALCVTYEAAFRENGLTPFAPVPCVINGMTVRLAGDGPSSWAIYANVARPRALCKWGTLPGAYTGGTGEREHIGGKPLWLMHALVRDYSRRGDLVCDPCAGGGTTLIAALGEGRRTVGAEVSAETHALAVSRASRGVTPSFAFAEGA